MMMLYRGKISYEKLFDYLWYSILAEDPILYQEIRIWSTIINSLIEWKELKVLQTFLTKFQSGFWKELCKTA